MQAYIPSWRLMSQVFETTDTAASLSPPRMLTRAARRDAADGLASPPDEAQPAPMLVSLCAGAAVGLFITRLATGEGAPLVIGALAGAAAGGLSYALSVCMPAVCARDCAPSEAVQV